MGYQENLYQMYRNNNLRLGYWVVRDSWGNTVARVTAIENVEEGSKIKGRYPYYGNPRVWADFYDLRTQQRVSTHSEISCPGTYAYQRVSLSHQLAQALGFTPEEAGCPPEPELTASVSESPLPITAQPFQQLLQQLEAGMLTTAQVRTQLHDLLVPQELVAWKTGQLPSGTGCNSCGQESDASRHLHPIPHTYADNLHTIREAAVQYLQLLVASSITEQEAETAAAGEERQACPVCFSVSIRERKTMTPRFLCARIHGFDTPTTLFYYPHVNSTDRVLALRAAKEFLVSFKAQAALKSYVEEVAHLALRETLRQAIAFINEPSIMLCSACISQATAPLLSPDALELVERIGATIHPASLPAVPQAV